VTLNRAVESPMNQFILMGLVALPGLITIALVAYALLNW
jgi:hypothetical protein